MEPHTSYLICATPRSGSTLLCEALENTGVAGHPKEYFEALKETGLPRQPKEYFESLENSTVLELLGDYSRLEDVHGEPTFWDGTGYAHYLTTVLDEGTTPNGVFGAKMMWGYFGDFIDNMRQIPAYRQIAVPDILTSNFTNLHYVWVTRLDKVRQAVSLWKAIQTWNWSQHEQALPVEKRTCKELVFNFEAIDHLVQGITAHEAAWWQYFNDGGIRPYIVVYEELVPAYETTALNILRYLHIPIPQELAFGERQMKQQANSLSDEWVERYTAIKGEYSAV